jgi:hypothetical protein
MAQAWTYVSDPGTHADTEGTLVRLVAFLITIGGMLVFALMIGIISESIGESVDELKKGKSRVLETGHTLILGWNDKALAIIQEISLANQSEGGGSIVALTEFDKEEMEHILQNAIDSRENPLTLYGTEVRPPYQIPAVFYVRPCQRAGQQAAGQPCTLLTRSAPAGHFPVRKLAESARS